jgi:hypothetical protein
MLQVRLSGLPFTNNYDVVSKNRKNWVVVVPSTTNGISALPNALYGYGSNLYPAFSFQLVDTIRYYDLSITYQTTVGSSILFTTTAGNNFALPNCQYQFIIWPIEPRKAKIQLNGYPTSQKRIRLETEDDCDAE